METTVFIGLVGYAFTTSISPGPNNLILMSSGANFGVRRSVPLMLGMVLGFGTMLMFVGTGTVQVFEQFPITRRILIVCSLVYALYLAWQIGRSDAFKDHSSTQLMTATDGAMFQWINPKGWIMALTSITLFAPNETLLSIFVVSAVFVIVGLPCVLIWTLFGMHIRSFLNTPKRLRIFNITMAILLIISVLPVLNT